VFKHVCIVWGVGLTLVTFGLAVKSAPSSAPPVPSVALAAPQRTAQQTTAAPKPWSPEQYRDFARRVVEACDRLPIGDRNRPSEAICGPRRWNKKAPATDRG